MSLSHHLETCSGVLLTIFGMAQMLTGALFFERLAFAYGLLSSYLIILSIFLLFDLNLQTWPLRAFMRTHGAVLFSMLFGWLSCCQRRVQYALTAAFCGVSVWSLIVICCHEFEVSGVGMVAAVLVPAVLGAILECFSALLVPLLTTVCGYLFFVEGMSVLLSEPLHHVIGDALMGESVTISKPQLYVLHETLFLAFFSLLFQYYLQRRPHQETDNKV